MSTVAPIAVPKQSIPLEKLIDDPSQVESVPSIIPADEAPLD
jgi:hypothetical protein